MLIDDVDHALVGSSANGNQKGFANSAESNLCHIIDQHRGIMILTAKERNFASQEVLSRIYVSLYFPPLNEEATLLVWQMNFDLLDTHDMADVDTKSEQAILQFVKQKYENGARWDGRQIRNCFQIAISLAKFSAIKQKSHGKNTAGELGGSEYPLRLTVKDLERAASAMGF